MRIYKCIYYNSSLLANIVDKKQKNSLPCQNHHYDISMNIFKAPFSEDKQIENDTRYIYIYTKKRVENLTKPNNPSLR